MGILNYEVMLDSRLLTSVSGLSILDIKHYIPGQRTLSQFILARMDRRKINSAFFTERHIFIRCCIQATTRAQRDDQFDSLMAIIQGLEKTLIVPSGSSKRAFTVTYDEITINEDVGSYIEFTLDFICSDNFGYDLNFTQLISDTGRTLYNYTDSFTIDGSAYWQAPIIKLTFSAITGGANATVKVVNPATGQTCQIMRTWAAGNMLVVDSQNKTVQVNGTDVEFTGAVPEWGLGPGYLQTQDTFTTRTMQNFSYYYRRWA